MIRNEQKKHKQNVVSSTQVTYDLWFFQDFLWSLLLIPTAVVGSLVIGGKKMKKTHLERGSMCGEATVQEMDGHLASLST